MRTARWLVPGLLALAATAPAQDEEEGRISIRLTEGSAPAERDFGVRLADPSARLAPRSPGEIPEGHVLFSFDEADLATEVLPELERQTGLAVEWQGGPRAVSLRLTRPVDWETGLDLICRFARVHVTEDHTGDLVLRDRWAGADGNTSRVEEQLPPELFDDEPLAAQGKRRSVTGRDAARRILARNAKALDDVRYIVPSVSYHSGTGRFVMSRVQGRYYRAAPVRARARIKGQYPRARQVRGQYPRARQVRGQYPKVRRQRGQYPRVRQVRGQYPRVRQVRPPSPRARNQQNNRYPQGRVRAQYPRNR